MALLAAKSFGISLVDAAATGAAFVGVDVAINKAPVSQQELMKGGLSAGCDLAGVTATGVILPYVANIGGANGSAIRTYLNPVLSGAIYVAASTALKWDNRSWMEKFLHQAGASVVGGYLAAPLYRLVE